MFGVIKCHRCNHIWIYTGQALSTICPDCKTTVRILKCLVPINWDFDITTGDLSTQKGLALPYIDKWDTKLDLKLFVIAGDTPHGQILPFSFPLKSGLVTQEEMKTIIGQNPFSGRYPLSKEITDKLKRMEFK